MEPLGGRQTWMQAQIWIAGTAAMSIAHAAGGVDGLAHAQSSFLNTPYDFSVSSSYQTAQITPAFTIAVQQRAYAPKTELGRKLLEIRGRSIRSGLNLLTSEEIRNEVAHRRGELP